MFANAPAGAQEPLDMLVVSRWVTLLLYSVTVVLGIGGNSVVIYSARNIKTKVTNVFLVNLAVADLIFCFTRILSLVHRLRFNDWPFGSFLCKFNGFFKYINMFCSVFLLAVISLDRALCVCRPIFTKTRRTFFVARVVAVCVWTLAIVLSVPFFMYRDIYTNKYNKTKCNIDKGQEKDVRIYLYVLRFVCGFLLPFWLILVCSVVAGLGIKRLNLSRKKRSLRILVVLVTSFFLCWAPYHCLQLFKVTESYTQVLKPWQRITSAIGYFNSCVNPFLYYCLGMELGGCFRQRQHRVYSRAMVIEEAPHGEGTPSTATRDL